MAPFAQPQGPASAVVFERYYLAANFTSGIGYGAQGVLYLICTHYLWAQRKARRINKFILAYITLLFLVSTVVEVAQAHRTQLAFIDNRDLPGGAWAYYEASYNGTSTIVGLTAGMVVMFLSELFMVWRCWVVWYSVSRRAAYTVAFFPALTLAASFACAVPCSLMTHHNSPIAGIRTDMWLILWYTLTLGTNVLATGLILARLIAHRRAMREIFTPHSEEYASLISMLVESAALYSIVGVGFLIATGVGSPVREPLSDAIVSTQVGLPHLCALLLVDGE
ncbi:hypothetical protein BD779DRAFT_1518647 [Infundibulicybe gibba]|nr:hypothetical protein BD779DRAFT_1518647 [Infundibulicybe gibba]